MPRGGKDFEREYEWLYELDKAKYTVTSPAYVDDKVTGGKREIDVLVEYLDAEDIKRRIAVECRDRKSNEDVMWIEQLKTKKEDLELDYIIATTTKSFTKGAIEKARYHGIVIERAEMFNKELLENISNEFFVDLFFLKFELHQCDFVIKTSKKSSKQKSFKQLMEEIPIYQHYELKNELNEIYCSIDPHQIMNKENFDKQQFFEKTENSFITLNINLIFSENNPAIINKLGIVMANIKVKMIPFHISLPLNKSLSVFEIERKKNKKYRAFFGNEEEYVEYGYFENGETYSKMELKERKYRLVGFNMYINTIFPDMEKNFTIDINEIMAKGIGSFDFSKVL